jgi:Sec7-like guanine-nucleotide exchange factor
MFALRAYLFRLLYLWLHVKSAQEYVALSPKMTATFDQALRSFLAQFRIPGEAQKIERILESFAKGFYAKHPELFQHQDTPFILAFSVVMLQTDLHNKANSKRMTKEEFVRNNRGIDAGDDLPYIFLSDIYDRIRSSEFKLPDDYSIVVRKTVSKIGGLLESFAHPCRQFL